MKKSIVLALSILAYSTATVAVDHNIGKLKYVQAQTNGNIYIQPISSWSSPQGCAGTWIKIDMSTPGGKEAYATALAAFLSNSNVRIRLSGTQGDCSYYDVTQMIRLYR